MAMTRTDTEIIEFIKAKPDSGLYEIAGHIHALHPEDYNHYFSDGIRVCRMRVMKRIKSLRVYGFITMENPTGKKAIYRIKED